MLLMKRCPNPFVQLLTEKANMIKQHLKDIQSSLVICANIGPNMVMIKLYNTLEEDSLVLHITVSNLGDIREQFYQMWIQLNYTMREYCPHCPPV